MSIPYTTLFGRILGELRVHEVQAVEGDAVATLGIGKKPAVVDDLEIDPEGPVIAVIGALVRRRHRVRHLQLGVHARRDVADDVSESGYLVPRNRQLVRCALS